jgi:hypothetical protein
MASGYLRYPHLHGDLLTFAAGDDVWLAPAAGGRAWRLSADDVPVSYPRFSRDGSQVAWTSRRDGHPEVYSADTEGSAAARLTYWGDPQTRVTGWTAAGEVLAITSANQPAAKYRRAYAVSLDGTPPRLLPFGAVSDGWGVENYGVDPDVEVLMTPDDAAVGRDPQLETAIQLALDVLDKQSAPAPPELATGPVKSRRPLPPRPPRAAG